MSKIHFKYGAMNSGKSDTLIKTAYNYEERGLRVLVIKPAVDTKGNSDIVSRGGYRRAVDILVTPRMDLLAEIKKYYDVSCVLVDESQFLSTEQISQLYQVAKRLNISVICYGLRTDFRNKLFPGSQRLFEIVDSIEKLPTMCSCGAQAEFNTRKIDGQYVFDGSQVAIDGDKTVSYDSLCGLCYRRAGGALVPHAASSC